LQHMRDLSDTSSTSDGSTEHDEWWLGVIIAIIGAFSGSLGDNLVKLSYNTLGKLPEDQQGTRSIGRIFRSIRSCICVCCDGAQRSSSGGLLAAMPELVAAPDRVQQKADVLFLCGWILTLVINTLCTFLSMAFAPASLITPFAGVHLLWNVWLANWINNEPVSPRDYVASALIIAGVVVVVTAGAKESPDYPLNELEELFFAPPFVVTMGLGVLMFCRLQYGIRQSENTRRVSLAALAGLLGAFSNPLIKVIVEIIKDVVDVDGAGFKVFLHWATWFFIAATILTAVFQLHFLNTGLASFGARCHNPPATVPLFTARTNLGFGLQMHI